MTDIALEVSDNQGSDRDKNLISWLESLTKSWRDHRDTNFSKRWDEYYRLWRGIFKENDRTIKSERSKLISPALQSAIEATVAEIEEAVFGKKRWFDMHQDVLDAADPKQREKLESIRRKLDEDIERAKVKSSCRQTFLLGALYGTGIGKIGVEKVSDYKLDDELQLEEIKRWQVNVTPVDPREFLSDPSAPTVDESMGCVHETVVPKADVLSKMNDGIYLKRELGEWGEPSAVEEEESNTYALGRTKLFEYHGLVPKSLMPTEQPELPEGATFEDLSGELENDEIDVIGDTLVEAIVVVANGTTVIKADINPLPRSDRAFIAYQHDTVPNRFWGRGVAEKGYNPQKALDTDLRARIDALAFAVRPMLGIDALKIPRGQKFTVTAGKSIFTNGNPHDAFAPLKFGNVDPNSFLNAKDMERMVQMGTGAVDTAQAGAMPIGAEAGGMSLLTAATVKRTKRTIRNIEENFISPMIHKIAWRYFHFDDDRYPVKDMKFSVNSSLGIMAKEMESQQYMNMLKTVDSQSPGYWMLMRGIYENTSLSNREGMLALIEKMLQSTTEAIINPPEPPPDPMVQVTMADIKSRERVATINARIQLLRVRSELMNVNIKKSKADAEEANLDADSALKLAKAEAETLGSEVTALLQEVDSLKEKSTEDIEDVGRENI